MNYIRKMYQLIHSLFVSHFAHLNLHNYFDIHVCPYGVSGVTSHFQFLLCSEFQKPSQTTTERGEAELRILDFKTTLSEFQKPVRPLSCEAKPSYVHTILKKTSPPQSQSQAVVCVSTPRMYPRSGYFLVF